MVDGRSGCCLIGVRVAGLLDKDTAAALVSLLLAKGAVAELPSFPEKVRSPSTRVHARDGVLGG